MKKWFKRITAGAVAAVVFGMALMPQGESRAAAARMAICSLKCLMIVGLALEYRA